LYFFYFFYLKLKFFFQKEIKNKNKNKFFFYLKDLDDSKYIILKNNIIKNCSHYLNVIYSIIEKIISQIEEKEEKKIEILEKKNEIEEKKIEIEEKNKDKEKINVDYNSEEYFNIFLQKKKNEKKKKTEEDEILNTQSQNEVKNILKEQEQEKEKEKFDLSELNLLKLMRKFEVYIIPHKELTKITKMRGVNSDQIGSLISLKGIVTRCSSLKNMIQVAGLKIKFF
jgi:DNA replicative helicase MCM subunit Mcm2 (Cdc46/Mcm family)